MHQQANSTPKWGKHNNQFLTTAKGQKAARTPKYKPICEHCGASRRLIAFKTASGRRYLCRAHVGGLAE